MAVLYLFLCSFRFATRSGVAFPAVKGVSLKADAAPWNPAVHSANLSFHIRLSRFLEVRGSSFFSASDFFVAPSSVFPRMAVGYVFWAQGSNTIRAQSTCQKLSLSVPIMGPLLVPRFGAKKMSPHSGETYSRPRFRVCFWFLKWGRDLDPGGGIQLPRCTASAGCVTTCRRMLDKVVEYV